MRWRTSSLRIEMDPNIAAYPPGHGDARPLLTPTRRPKSIARLRSIHNDLSLIGRGWIAITGRRKMRLALYTSPSPSPEKLQCLGSARDGAVSNGTSTPQSRPLPATTLDGRTLMFWPSSPSRNGAHASPLLSNITRLRLAINPNVPLWLAAGLNYRRSNRRVELTPTSRFGGPRPRHLAERTEIYLIRGYLLDQEVIKVLAIASEVVTPRQTTAPPTSSPLTSTTTGPRPFPTRTVDARSRFTAMLCLSQSCMIRRNPICRTAARSWMKVLTARARSPDAL